MGSHEQLTAARREIAALRTLGALGAHPHLVPLLDAGIDTPGAGRTQGLVWAPRPLHAHLLFPFLEVSPCGPP